MNKTILITGSTDGIGKLAAIQLAKEGHKVYVHGRNLEKLNAAVAEIKALSNNDLVGGFLADFSDLNAVKQLAEDIKLQLPYLDVLINNAGVLKSALALSKDGYELRYAVNYLAPYVLTKALTPLLEKSSDARIINLSSAAQSDISYDVMLGKRSINVNGAYAQSKLALTMWTNYLAAQLTETTVIAVNPGSLLNTKMAKEAYGQHWSPADKGSDILVDLTLNDVHKAHSGHYFDNDSGRYSNAHPDAYDQSAIEDLILFTEKLIN